MVHDASVPVFTAFTAFCCRLRASTMKAEAAGPMSVFTQAEIAYLNSQMLGRLATVGPNGVPHVAPVGFRYNPELETIDIGGHDFAKRKKFRDVSRHPQVALVVDDIASVNPWRVRGIEIRGEADVLETGGEALGPGYDPELFRIAPRRIVAWGIEGDPRSANARSVG
jgi:pyridoxamine 5'-phosphate oxidase family protein